MLKRWIGVVVEHVRGRAVDAIVGPDTRGNVIAVAVAVELGLPYIPIQEAGKFDADPSNVIRYNYRDRRNTVKLFLRRNDIYI